MLNIKGLDKARVLVALYRGSKGKGMSFLDPMFGTDLTVEMARNLLSKTTYFDYLYGKIMKINLSGDRFDSRLYDRDNGYPAAEMAILKEFGPSPTGSYLIGE
jgi:hypothetical protein